jgi:hypothetical protein
MGVQVTPDSLQLTAESGYTVNTDNFGTIKDATSVAAEGRPQNELKAATATVFVVSAFAILATALVGNPEAGDEASDVATKGIQVLTSGY